MSWTDQTSSSTPWNQVSAPSLGEETTTIIYSIDAGTMIGLPFGITYPTAIEVTETTVTGTVWAGGSGTTTPWVGSSSSTPTYTDSPSLSTPWA